jgi:lysophospholipase L1-like esterase
MMRARRCARAALLPAILLSTPVVAQTAASAPPVAVQGMVDGDPCPPLPDMPSSALAARELFLTPGPFDLPRMMGLMRDPAYAAYTQAKEARDAQDWPGLCTYRAANAQLAQAGTRPQLVLFGDSITENWTAGDPTLFGTRVIGRGISGQTSAQMLVRFRADVIALRPQIVHILAGTNDVAGNRGPETEEDFRNNIRSMVELARANHIRVVLGAIPPARRFFWRPQLTPAARIVALNLWLRRYAAERNIPFIDYHQALADGDGGMQAALSNDGVHPNRSGYAVMRPLLLRVIPQIDR